MDKLCIVCHQILSSRKWSGEGSGLRDLVSCARPYKPHLYLQVKGLIVVTVNRGCQVCNCCSWGIAKLNITCEKYCTAVGNFNGQLDAQEASKLR